MNLYEMNDELIDLDKMIDVYASENEGEIPEILEEKLDSLKGDRNEKLLNIAIFIKNLKTNAKGYKEEKDRLAAKEKALKAKAERLSQYISFNMQEGEIIEDVKASLSWRESEKVVVECMLDDLPEKYIKTESSARLADLKADIKAGDDIEGVRIKAFHNLQIK